MNRLPKNLIFPIIMAFLGLLLVAVIFYAISRRADAVAAEMEFLQKLEEHQQLIARNNLPVERNVELTQREIEIRRQKADFYREALSPSEEFQARLANPPASRADFVFDIVSFAEEYRQRAADAGLEVGNNEFFSFQAYAQAGPPEARIPEVYKQRQVVAHILDQIFEIRPIAFVSIAREGAANGAAAGAGAGGERYAGARLDPALSLRAENLVETTIYQVVFVGRTSHLRNFVNNITEFGVPLAVRSINATLEREEGGRRREDGPPPVSRRGLPAGRRGQPPPSPPPAPPMPPDAEREEPRDQNVPIIGNVLTRFTVVLEYIDVHPEQPADETLQPEATPADSGYIHDQPDQAVEW